MRGVQVMARATKRRLKVFGAQFGFHESVVAAPSQAAALKAWGVHRNLFASGYAHPVEDPDAVAAATAHPGVPLRRPVGSNAAFALTAGAPKLASENADRRARNRSKPRPPPDRGALDAAEAALAALEAEQSQTTASLARRRATLDQEIAATEEAQARARKAAVADVAKARAAFRKAVGSD
jgi:hypothetical protein